MKKAIVTIHNLHASIVADGKERHILKGIDLESYFLTRGKRGAMLPKKFRLVDFVECI